MKTWTEIVSTTGGADKVIRTLMYVLRLIIARNPKLHPRFALLLPALSESRVVLRFFGLLHNHRAFLQLLSTLRKERSLSEQNAVAMLQILAMYAYYPMEHLYWLDAKKAINLPIGLGPRLSQWSCRAWLFSVLLDIYIIGWEALRICDKRKRLQASISQSKSTSSTDLERIAELNERRYQEMKGLNDDLRKLVIKMVVSLGDLPLAWTWSWDNTSLSPFFVGLFGSVSSLAGLYLKFDP